MGFILTHFPFAVLQLAAAILYQAAEAHQVKLTLDQVSLALGAGSKTASTRLRELRTALAVEGQKLPWGADVTESSVKDHLPMILQLLRFSDGADRQDSALPAKGEALKVPAGRVAGVGAKALPTEGSGSAKSLTGRPSSDITAVAQNPTAASVEKGVESSKSLEAAHINRNGGESRAGVKPKEGLGRRMKRARELNSRPGTPEGMYSGPLGSYVQLKKARNESTEEPSAEKSGATGGACEEDIHTRGQSMIARSAASGTMLENAAVERVQIGADSGVNSLQPNATERSVRSHVENSSQADKTKPIDTPELPPKPVGVNASEGIESSRDQHAPLLLTSGETQTLAGSAEGSVRLVGTELQAPESGEPSTGGEVVPSFDTWQGLPPSFRAQATERQR